MSNVTSYVSNVAVDPLVSGSIPFTESIYVTNTVVSNAFAVPSYGLVINSAGQWVGDPAGLTGFTGSRGELGFTGSTGGVGFTGSLGGVGFTGSVGATGSVGGIGFTGSVGDVGFTGSVGSVGFTGSQGDAGFTGSAGIIGFTGSIGDVGFTGSTGSVGFTGSAGIDGFTGSVGFTGSAGADGRFGGASFYYTYDTTIYQGTVPDGFFRLDNSSATTVTFIALADTDRFGTDISSFIQTVDDSTSTIKGYIKLTEEANSLNFTIFAITGEHYIHDDHFHIPIAYVSGTTDTPTSNTNAIISFVINGDRGDVGFTGSQGNLGFTGSIGFTGSQGDIGYTGSQGDTGFVGSVGFTGSTGDSGLLTWVAVTSNYTATNLNGIVADTSAGSFTVTLPASPSNGFYITIVDGGNFETNNLIVARNGSTIEGIADDLIIDIGIVSVELVYDGATWQVYSNVGQQGEVGFTGSQGDIGFTGSRGEVLDKSIALALLFR
jgi:hypothetical protein